MEQEEAKELEIIVLEKKVAFLEGIIDGLINNGLQKTGKEKPKAG